MPNANTRDNYIVLVNTAQSIEEKIEHCEAYLTREDPQNIWFRFCLGSLYCQQGLAFQNNDDEQKKLSLLEKALEEFKYVVSDSKDDTQAYSQDDLVMLHTNAQHYIHQLASFCADKTPETDQKKEEYLKLALEYNPFDNKEKTKFSGPVADWLLYIYVKTERDLRGNFATRMLEANTFSPHAALALEEILEDTGVLRFDEAAKGTIFVSEESITKSFPQSLPESFSKSFPLDTRSYQVNLFLAAVLTREKKYELALQAAELAYLQVSQYIPLASIECPSSETVEFVIEPEIGKSEEKPAGITMHTLITKIGDRIVQKQQLYHPLQKVEKVALTTTDEKLLYALFNAGESPLNKFFTDKKSIQHKYNREDTLKLFVENKETFTRDYKNLSSLLVGLYKHRGNGNFGDIEDKLESLYKNILILQPEDLESRLRLGRLSFQKENFESAEYYYKQFLGGYENKFKKSNKQTKNNQNNILKDLALNYAPSEDLVAYAFSRYKKNSNLNNNFMQIDEKVKNSSLLKLVLRMHTARKEKKLLSSEAKRISWFGYDPLKIDSNNKMFQMIKMEVESLAKSNDSKK